MEQDFTLVDHMDHLKAFKGFIGKTVMAMSHCKYYYNDKPDSEADGDLEIKFIDGSVLTLSILGDGESIVAKAEPMSIPESFEVNDNNTCSWRRILLNNEPAWRDVVGTKLINIESMIDHWKDLKQKVLSDAGFLFQMDTL